jgi:Raf kinase inhibitor-like YbhB/YbcL family protein
VLGQPKLEREDDVPLSIRSTAFTHGAAMPKRYTCDGEDISPPLEWSGVPTGAKSLALIVDDPDAPDPKAPKRVWVHWVLYNVPPTAAGVKERVSGGGLPDGTREGLNDWKRARYGGPCPPIGRHRYFFKLYALDTLLPELGAATKSEVETAMRGHVLEQAELLGTYERG